jgi:hypothetical protein
MICNSCAALTCGILPVEPKTRKKPIRPVAKDKIRLTILEVPIILPFLRGWKSLNLTDCSGFLSAVYSAGKVYLNAKFYFQNF